MRLTNAKVEDEGAAAEQTRVLIKALPKLFAKYHADSMRMADLLLLPQLIKLDMYLELRMANVGSIAIDLFG